jgi:hypothetical protein
VKLHGSIPVVRKWSGMRTDPIFRCFDNPEKLNYGDSLVGVVSEFPSWLMVKDLATRCQVRISVELGSPFGG